MTKREQFDNVIEHIEEGNSLRSALMLDNTPASESFYKWIDEDEELAKRYARACARRADEIFEDIIDISDGKYTVSVVTINDDGVSETNDVADVNRNKLQVDARKWMLGKMNPKKYGDKSGLDVTTNGESVNIISLGNGTPPNESTSKTE